MITESRMMRNLASLCVLIACSSALLLIAPAYAQGDAPPDPDCVAASGVDVISGGGNAYEEVLRWTESGRTGYTVFSGSNRQYWDARDSSWYWWVAPPARGRVKTVGWTQWQFGGAVSIYDLSPSLATYALDITHGYVYLDPPAYQDASLIVQHIYVCPSEASTPTPAPTDTPTPTPAPTDTPTPTPAPTDTPTPTGGGGGGGGGGGSTTSTPPADWCGYVPQNPCYVEWVSWRTALAQQSQTQIAAQQPYPTLDLRPQQTAASALSTIVARPSATPEYAQERRTAEVVLTAGPQPVGYAPAGPGPVSMDRPEIGLASERYSFGCPLRYDDWNVEICINYVYVSAIRVAQIEIPFWPFTAALVLVVVGLVVRR